MLRRELGIWRRLEHSNVAPFLGIAYGFGIRGAMSLVSLWMPNDTLYHFLARHDDHLHVGHRLQFVRHLTPTTSTSSDPTMIAAGHCQWVALL